MNVAGSESTTADDGDGKGEAALRTAHCVWIGGLGWRVVWVQGGPTDVVDDYTWQTRTHPQTTRSFDPVATTLPFHPPSAEAGHDVTSGVVLRRWSWWAPGLTFCLLVSRSETLIILLPLPDMRC